MTKKQPNSLLGNKIRQIRKSLGWSQEKLAQKVGVSNKTISAYESGRATPPTKILLKISQITNTPLEKLLRGQENDWEKEIVFQIIKQVGILKKIKRIGWAIKGVENAESVADHDFRTAILAILLSKKLKLNEHKIIKMALIRDIGKTGVGEKKWEAGEKRVSPFKEKFQKEKETVYKIFGKDKKYQEIIELWKEWDQQKSKEARILKQISKLEMVIQALEYEQAGYPAKWFDEFWENAEKYLEGQELEELFRLLQQKRSKIC